MLTQFSRTELLLGKSSMEILKNARVAVFGIGGVGGYVCEALVRSGVYKFDLIDDDKVCLTNLNRQIIATRKTVGKYKAEVMRDRILEINPDAEVTIHKCFFLPENEDEFPFETYDYIVDAVDTVTAKLALVMKAQALHIPIISRCSWRVRWQRSVSRCISRMAGRYHSSPFNGSAKLLSCSNKSAPISGRIAWKRSGITPLVRQYFRIQ